MTRRRFPPRAAPLVLLALAIAIATGCGPQPVSPGTTPAPQPGSVQATGVVIDVDGPDPATVDRFSINTAEGLVLDFTVETLDITNGGLPAPHLRDHLVSGEPITVTYVVDEEGQNVALRYLDAE